MSEIAGTTPRVPPGSAEPPVHEAYSFACMKCGHGWEQAYEIKHHVDAKGRAFVTYHAGGQRVPSPLTRPTCANCGGHVVRIMRSGQIPAEAAGYAQQGIAGPLLAGESPHQPPHPPTATPPKAGGKGPDEMTGAKGPDEVTGARPEEVTHRRGHLSELFHSVFHRR